jgi:hydrogenase expression/formation protein HypC
MPRNFCGPFLCSRPNVLGVGLSISHFEFKIPEDVEPCADDVIRVTVRVSNLTYFENASDRRAPFQRKSYTMCLAIPGKIVEIAPGQDLVATVEVTGVRRKVQLALLQDEMPKTGDWVLIHVGFAMSKISEQDAEEQMRLLAALGETEQAMEEVRGYGLENSVGHDGPNA